MNTAPTDPDDQDIDPEDPDADKDNDEPTCPRCGGPIYSQPHWSYWQCDDCGYTEKKEEMDP